MKTWYDTKKRVASCTQNEQQQNVMLQALQRAGNGERKLSKESRTSCETCTYYIYDEEYECYLCDKNMDEDDYIRLMTNQHYQCPYYRNGDDYLVVRKQLQNHRKARKYKIKRKNKKKSGRIVGSDSPAF